MIYVIFKKSIHLFGLVANKGLGCSLWALYLLHKRLVSPRNVGIWIEPTTTASEGVFLTTGPSGMSPSIYDLTWHWTRCDVHSLHPELLCSEVQVFMFLVLSDFLPLWTSFTFETISVLSNVYYLRLFSCLPPPVTLIFISNRGQFFLLCTSSLEPLVVFPTWIYPGHIPFHCLNTGQNEQQANAYICAKVSSLGDVWCDKQPHSSHCPSSVDAALWGVPGSLVHGDGLPWACGPHSLQGCPFFPNFHFLSSLPSCFDYSFSSLFDTIAFHIIGFPWYLESERRHTHTHPPQARAHTHTHTNKTAYNKGFVSVHTFIAAWHLEWAPWSGLAWWCCGFLRNPVTQQVISPSTWPCRLATQSPVTVQHRPLPTHRGHRRRIWGDPHLSLLLLWLTSMANGHSVYKKKKKKKETDGYWWQTHSDGNHSLKLTLQWGPSSPCG